MDSRVRGAPRAVWPGEAASEPYVANGRNPASEPTINGCFRNGDMMNPGTLKPTSEGDHTRLRVRVNDRPVGWLGRRGRGSTFVYDPGVAPGDAVSLATPVREAPYNLIFGLQPAFDANVPEGSLNNHIKRLFAKGKGGLDSFEILSITGANQIGRVRVHPEGANPAHAQSVEDIDEILRENVTPSFVEEIMGRFGSTSGVSGVMPKVLVKSKSDVNPAPGTLPAVDHIIKIDDGDYPGLSLNEHHCLKAAGAGGNATVVARLGADSRMLAVRRFDGIDGRRLGIDDFTSLNGVTSDGKYSGSIETSLFKTIGKFPGEGKNQIHEDMFRLCVTNFALRNGDAHLKNFSVIYDDADRGPVGLAPAYDLVTTVAYIRNDLMALNLGGTKRWPGPKNVMALGKRAGLSEEDTRRIVEEVGSGVRRTMPGMLEEFTQHDLHDLGMDIAAAWSDGLVNSLGVEPG